MLTKGKQVGLLASVAVLMTGCMHDEMWQNHEKEVGRPFPMKYEAPIQQNRENSEQEPSRAEVAQLPPSQEGKPQVIQPEPWKGSTSPILSGIAVKDKNVPSGFVLSPYAPDKGLVDVTGFPAGTVVLDPYSDKKMKVPAMDEKPKEQVLKQAETQTPVVSARLPQVAPPPSLEQ